MSKQAIVGMFTLLGIVALFGVFYVISDLGIRSRGYKVGVHFASASGLRDAATVSLSGVPIGVVDDIVLQPDYSVEVVMAINPGYEIPVGSRYLIQAPITGEPSVLIEPPRNIAQSVETLPHKVLPLDQQPRGTNPSSFADLLVQGQGEIRRVDDMLAQVQTVEPQLLGQLKQTLSNANTLTSNANRSLTRASNEVATMTDTLQTSLTQASGNVVDLTGTLDSVVKRDSPQVDTLLAQLSTTSKSFGETVDSLKGLATNPAVKQNLLDTTRDFALTAHTFALLTEDLRHVTGNSQTQAQLRDTVAQIDATTQKVNSLVGQLGGTSQVYGVDSGASPAPVPAGVPPGQVPTSQPILPGTPPQSGAPAPSTTSTPHGSAAAPSGKGLAALKARVDQFTKDLITLQIRASDLAPLRPGSYDRNVSPLLDADRGPQSDVNMFILPQARTGVELGFNDIGSPYGNSTANALILSRSGGFTYGGGVLYSQLGFTAIFGQRGVSFETRAYDLRHPTLDEYINFLVARKFQLFAGERDLIHAQRRATFGAQFEL